MSNRKIGILLTVIALALMIPGVFLFFTGAMSTGMTIGGIIGIVLVAIGSFLLVFGAIGISLGKKS